MSKYIAQAIAVEAKFVRDIEPLETWGTLDLVGNTGLLLILDAGERYRAKPLQLALFRPQVNDILIKDDRGLGSFPV